MDFEPYFKVHNLVSVHPKSVILGQMTNLNMAFHKVVSVCRLVKTRPSSLMNFGTANSHHFRKFLIKEHSHGILSYFDH